MADQVSKAKHHLHEAQERRQEQVADFWQRQIIRGEQQRQETGQIRQGETITNKPRQHRQSP
jgi:hypothetical protein